MPLVSVIVPTYNYGHFIGQTIESLQAQTCGDWECVVVDDDSQDDTREVVARYAAADARVRYVHQRNQLQAVAKNTGLEQSAGRYVQFLDADDLLEPRKFERHVAYLERHPAVDIVYSSVRYFNSDHPAERYYSMAPMDRPWMPEVSGRGKKILLELVRHNIMAINSPLVRREVVREVGLFDPVLPPVEDWDFWIRCAQAGKSFQFLDAADTLALVRMHPASSSQNTSRMNASRLRLREKIRAITTDVDLLRINREVTATVHADCGHEQVARGRRLQGISRFLTAAAMTKRPAGRARWAACALLTPFLNSEQLKRVLDFSPTQHPAGELFKTKAAAGPPRRVD
ncbi:MAG: glycosyltransferase family 2 protein [Pyrinomonadaceae bacterium]